MGCEKMRIKMSAILVLVMAIFVGCSNSDNNDVMGTSDIKQMVQDYTVGELAAASASITSSELIVTDENKTETTYELPEDEFFVSVAPYVTETHPCDIHSLTGCQGELVEEDVQVYIEDSKGNVIVDELMQTEANGFIDFWLPRDTTFNVTMTQGDRETSSELTTYAGDNTCITTMKLT